MKLIKNEIGVELLENPSFKSDISIKIDNVDDKVFLYISQRLNRMFFQKTGKDLGVKATIQTGSKRMYGVYEIKKEIISYYLHLGVICGLEIGKRRKSNLEFITYKINIDWNKTTIAKELQKWKN